MIKVLVIQSPQINGVTWWRCFRPLSLLRKQYRGEIDFAFKHKDLSPVDLDFHDIILILRATTPDIIDYLGLAKRKGIPFIADLDDDLLHLPPSHPQYHEYARNRSIIEQFFRLADRVWVSTEQLLYVTDAIERGTVIPNAILPTDLPDSPAPDRNRWAWRGSSVHLEDVMAHAEWYNRIKPQPQEFAWIGWVPPLDHLPNARFLPYESDVETYFTSLRRQQYNVIWKPLVDNPFNRAKSNIAWLEATMGGGVCVTNFAPDEPIPKPAGWEFCIREMYSLDWEKEKAVETWRKSRATILENYNLHTVNELRFNDIKSLV